MLHQDAWQKHRAIQRIALLIVIALPVVAFAAAEAGPQLPEILTAREGEKWELVFSDEFNGATADLDANWNFQNAKQGHILCSRWRENVIAEKGLCRILNKKEQRGGQEWTAGSMSTKKEFKYGFFEARYRYGNATGLNNSFWMMTRGKTGVPGKFEIDIDEGHFPNEVNTNLHDWGPKHTGKGKAKTFDGQNMANDFHVFSLLWTEKELAWFVDGREIRREDNKLCHDQAPVILSSAIMKWAGDVTDKIDGTAMEADWVRVYQIQNATSAK